MGVAAGLLDAETLAANFGDLHPPLSRHEALVEADRCYFCSDAPCQQACPTTIDIPLFIREIAADNPLGAARHVHETLADDGTWMIVEPFANDTLEGNLNPVGRIFYSASTLICTPASRAQAGAMCLGAQAGEQRLRDVVTAGGFSQFHCATQTPFNLVFEARP